MRMGKDIFSTKMIRKTDMNNVRSYLLCITICIASIPSVTGEDQLSKTEIKVMLSPRTRSLQHFFRFLLPITVH